MNVDPGVTLNIKIIEIRPLVLVKIMKDKYHCAKGQEGSKLTHLGKGVISLITLITKVIYPGTVQLRIL